MSNFQKRRSKQEREAYNRRVIAEYEKELAVTTNLISARMIRLKIKLAEKRLEDISREK